MANSQGQSQKPFCASVARTGEPVIYRKWFDSSFAKIEATAEKLNLYVEKLNDTMEKIDTISHRIDSLAIVVAKVETQGQSNHSLKSK